MVKTIFEQYVFLGDKLVKMYIHLFKLRYGAALILGLYSEHYVTWLL